MKVYNLPEKPEQIKAFIFDIDSTLYTNPAYAHEQVDCQIRQFAKERGISADEARKMVSDFRKKFGAENGGKKISLGNTLVNFGVPIEKSVEWRKTLLEPADFLSYDPELVKVVTELKERAKVICVTNNPVLPARKTLEALGVADLIPGIIGLDTCFKSKPALEPFKAAVGELGVPVEGCVAVGDRYDMDIALPLEMGMAGILVTGVKEVYHIRKICYNDRV